MRFGLLYCSPNVPNKDAVVARYEHYANILLYEGIIGKKEGAIRGNTKYRQALQ